MPLATCYMSIMSQNILVPVYRNAVGSNDKWKRIAFHELNEIWIHAIGERYVAMKISILINFSILSLGNQLYRYNTW